MRSTANTLLFCLLLAGGGLAVDSPACIASHEIFRPGNVAPADPLFVAADKGDVGLQPGSPALGKGSDDRDIGAGGIGGAADGATPARAEGAPVREAAAQENTPAPDGDVSAKEAFEAAKELGTAEAWNAFLANYPTGFHADLARAYLKKTAGGAPAAPPATKAGSSVAQELACSEQSNLRSQTSDVAALVTFVNASGMYRSIQSIDSEGGIKDHGGLQPGERLTVDTFVTHPWKVSTGPGDCLQIFMPAAGLSTVELGPLAADKPKAPAAKKPAKKETLVCAENYKLRNGACVLQQNCGKNAYRSPEGDCYCKKNYEMRAGNCLWKQDKKGFEVKPWQKPGCSAWQAQCSQGNNKACGQFEANCQVN